MVTDLARNWWVLMLRGVLAILLGVLALVNPAATMAALILVFAAFAVADGILSIITSLTAPADYRGWVWLLVSGLAGVVIGVLTFFWPGVTAVVLLYYVMAWLVVTGIFQIMAGIRLRKEITGEFWLILGGALAVIMGVYLMMNPAVGLLAMLWVLGFYAIVFGALLIAVSLRLRRVATLV